MHTFSQLDTYKISQKEKKEKFVIDYKVLVRLYGPIIGPVATSLYLTMISELSLNKNQKEPTKISRLHKLLQISGKQFDEAVEALKDNQLVFIKINKKINNSYLFELMPTIHAKNFFETKKFKEALEVMVGDEYFQQVKSYFLSEEFEDDDYVSLDDNEVEIDMTEQEFYDYLSKYFSTSLAPITLNQKVRNEISRLKRLFNLSYDDMILPLVSSYDGETIDLDKLNNLIYNRFGKKDEDGDQKLQEIFESVKSIPYYKAMVHRETLTPHEIKMINELLEMPYMTDGILNVIFNYYFKHGNGASYHGDPTNYFKKVINSLNMNNVRTTIEALDYFRNLRKKYNQQNTQVVMEETTPNKAEEVDWPAVDELKKLLGG